MTRTLPGSTSSCTSRWRKKTNRSTRGLRTSNPTAVRRHEHMALSRSERERVTDSRFKLKSVSNSLSQIDPAKVPDIEGIQECLENAEQSLKEALQGEK